VGNGYRYGHLDARRVWGRTLKLLPTRIQTFFINAGIGKGTIVPYPLASLVSCVSIEEFLKSATENFPT